MTDSNKFSTMSSEKNPNLKEMAQFEELEKYINEGKGNLVEKFKNFTKYVTRPDITKFLVKYELFKKVLPLAGSIIEIGVLHGVSLMGFAHFSSIFEHLNVQRKIIGFDTFEGFPSDGTKFDDETVAKKGYLNVDSFADISESIRIYDMNRSLNHITKVQLIKGDIIKTVPKYMKDNPHTIVSLLYLDADLYEPTKIAIENFYPRMPKGSIIAFDDFNEKTWKGETQAVLETLDIKKLKIQRFTYDTRIAYAVIE